MYLRSLYGLVVFSLVSGIIAFFSSYHFQPTAGTYLMIAALSASVVAVRSTVAPYRSFWHRLMARTSDPVPRIV